MEIQTEQENGVPVITWDFPPQYGGYAIYRTENPGGEYTEIQLIEDSQISSFVDETAVPGKTYYYMVRPFLRTEDSIEYGFFSHEKAITR